MKTKKNLVIVLYNKPVSTWLSTKIIWDEVYNFYKKQKIELISVDNFLNHTIFDRPKILQIRRLVLFDLQPHPIYFLKEILKSCDSIRSFDFLVAGQFIFFPQYWLELSQIVNGKKIRILTSSPQQKQLISSFLEKKSRGLVHNIPLAVNLQKTNSIPKKQMRKHPLILQIKQLQKKGCSIYGYFGRISFQKNVIQMTELFLNYTTPDSHLIIAGHFDDLGNHGFAKAKLGVMFFDWLNFYNQLPKSQKDRVHFFDQINHEIVLEVLAEINVVLNLSTFIGEDFGLGVLEALMAGTPVVCSSWGGFNQFRHSKYGPYYLIPEFKKSEFHFEPVAFKAGCQLAVSSEMQLLRKSRSLYFRNLFSKVNFEREMIKLSKFGQAGALRFNREMVQFSKVTQDWISKDKSLFLNRFQPNSHFKKLTKSYLQKVTRAKH